MYLSNANVKKSIIFLIATLVAIAFTIFCELNAPNTLMPTISLLLLLNIFIANLYLNNNDYLSPLTMFSVMYSGYAIGGFYYAFSINNFGKFVDFLVLPNLEVVEFMRYGLAYSLICYILFVLGYVFCIRPVEFNTKRNSGFWSFFGNSYMFIVIPFLLIGLVHWYIVATKTAGSLYNLILYFQAFPHLAEDAGVSTLPYHFYLGGIYIWLLGLTITGKKIGYQFVFFSLLGMLIVITQGRITLAVTYVISQLVFYGLINKNNKTKVLYMIISLLLIAFGLFFLRMLSNNLFIGGELRFSDINMVEAIIGGGNVADLQQLVIIFSTFDVNNALLGSSYFDWLRNTFGSLFDIPPSSIGLLIKDLYIPDTSGAPTPGAIGEAYANFNFVAPFFMFLVGAFFAIMKRVSLNSGSLLILLVYSVFLTRFVFIYPKVDSTMMSNFFWGVAPLLITIFLYYILYRMVKPSSY